MGMINGTINWANMPIENRAPSTSIIWVWEGFVQVAYYEILTRETRIAEPVTAAQALIETTISGTILAYDAGPPPIGYTYSMSRSNREVGAYVVRRTSEQRTYLPVNP